MTILTRRTWAFLTIASLSAATITLDILQDLDSWFLLSSGGRFVAHALTLILTLQVWVFVKGVVSFRSFRYQQLVLAFVLSASAWAFGVAEREQHAVYRVFCNVQSNAAACGAASRTSTKASSEARYAVRACSKSLVGHGLICEDWEVSKPTR